VFGAVSLALLGGAAGLLLATWNIDALHALAPDISRLETVSVHLPVLVFAIAVTLLTGALFGTAPILHVVRSDLATWLRAAAVGVAGERRDGRATRWSWSSSRSRSCCWWAPAC
jgi:hypothetical protein